MLLLLFALILIHMMLGVTPDGPDRPVTMPGVSNYENLPSSANDGCMRCDKNFSVFALIFARVHLNVRALFNVLILRTN